MKSSLAVGNLVGVVLLSGICALQWSDARQLRLRAEALEKERSELRISNEEREKALGNAKADLEQFRAQVTRDHEGRQAAEAGLSKARADIRELSAERDRLNSALTAWREAVASRDERLMHAQESLAEVGQSRNAAIEQFNTLARSHREAVERLNAVIQELNRLRSNGTSGVPAKPIPGPSP